MALEFPPEAKTTAGERAAALHGALRADLQQRASRSAGCCSTSGPRSIPADTETTGIAFQFDKPNAEPPQSILLATPPQFTGAWNWSDLVQTLHETLDMARLRAVEPQQLDQRADFRVPAGHDPRDDVAADHHRGGSVDGQQLREPNLMNEALTIRNLAPVLAGRTLLPTITRYNRLESRPRTDNFTRALRAEVRDALWMLCKQWQMGEFAGDDAGSPVGAKIHVDGQQIAKYEPLGQADAGLRPGDTARGHRRAAPDSAFRPARFRSRSTCGCRWAGAGCR